MIMNMNSILKKGSLFFIISLFTYSAYGQIYFENGTCKCPDASPGDTAVIDGTTYTVVDDLTIDIQILAENYKLCTTLGITRTRTSAYHPQGNGQVERMNRTLKDMLAKMLDNYQRNWDTQLQKAVFAYRVSINETTGFTPLFQVNFGRSPKLPIDVMIGFENTREQSLPTYVRNTRRSLQKTWDEI